MKKEKKPVALTPELYNEIKEYIRQDKNFSYYVIFVLVSEHGYVANDLFPIRNRDISIQNGMFFVTKENGKRTQFPKEMNKDLEKLYDPENDPADYFFHTQNLLMIRHSNFSSYLKTVADRFNVEDLSCRFLSNFFTNRKRIVTKQPATDYVMPADILTPNFDTEFCTNLTQMIATANELMIETKNMEDDDSRREKAERLLAYMRQVNENFPRS